MDEGHIITDKILGDLEKGLLEVYKDSYNTIKPQLDDVKDLIEKLSEEDDPVKKIVLQRREKRLTILLNNISKDIRDINVLAERMINDEMLNVYAENINYGAYFLESESGYNLNFDLYNKEILKKLYKDNENPFTKIALKNIKDKSRIYRDLRRNFAAAIRNGETIKEIAKRVQGVVNKNMNDSIRIARTETTRLESIGREEVFNKGQEMGLKMKKVWVSTSDKRTRESHLMLNGKTIDVDKRFSNGLLYPGEHGGRAEEVINCRCTHIVELQGIKKSANLEKLDKELQGVTYNEWKNRGKDIPVIKSIKTVTNKYNKEIEFNLDSMKEESSKLIKETLTELSDQFNTRMNSVTNGKLKNGMKAYVGTDFNMVIASPKIDTIVHEFAHTLSTTTSEKLGITNDKEFWKELKKIRTQYNKAISKGEIQKISSYADEQLGEFMAEAFAHSYLKDSGKLGWEYGKDFTYSDKVFGLIKKYFGK